MHEISKEFTFSASHQLGHLERDDHPCKRLHGHNYIVRVTLRGTPDANGFVQDYRDLDFFKRYIDEVFDHQHLNEVMQRLFDLPPYGASRLTTAENLATYFYHWIAESGKCPGLYSVAVSETPKTWAVFIPEVDNG
jgi:6-pyruvoyltetrahydropterin/6-carboxytetrahydropterin synthase